MKEKMKKNLCLILLVCGVVLALAACAAKNDKDEGAVRSNEDRVAYKNVQDQLKKNYQWLDENNTKIVLSLSEDGMKASYLKSIQGEDGKMSTIFHIGSLVKGKETTISLDGKEYTGTECQITPVIEKDDETLSIKIAEKDEDTMLLSEGENEIVELKKTDEIEDYAIFRRRRAALYLFFNIVRTDEENEVYKEAVSELTSKYFYSESGAEKFFGNALSENYVYFAVNDDWSKAVIKVDNSNDGTNTEENEKIFIGNITKKNDSTISFNGKDVKAVEYTATPFFEMDFQPINFLTGETDSGNMVISIDGDVYEVEQCEGNEINEAFENKINMDLVPIYVEN